MRSSGKRQVSVDCDTVFHELREALRKPGCAVCRMVSDATERHLRYLFHESVNDPETRETLRASVGFCSRHAAEVVRCCTALGASIVYNDMAVVAGRRIDEIARGGKPRPRTECPVCVTERDESALYASALAQGVAEAVMRDAYAASEGLCQNYLETVLEVASPEARAFLAHQECGRLSSLSTELQLFIRKNDYRFASEPVGAERDAWLRAMAKIAGTPGPVPDGRRS